MDLDERGGGDASERVHLGRESAQRKERLRCDGIRFGDGGRPVLPRAADHGSVRGIPQQYPGEHVGVGEQLDLERHHDAERPPILRERPREVDVRVAVRNS